MLPHFREDYCDDDYKTSCNNWGQIRLSRGNLSEKVEIACCPVGSAEADVPVAMGYLSLG